MDNASSHRNPAVKELIKERNDLLYSVPYQHYTNAIENFFSVLKSYLKRREINNLTELLRAIDSILKEDIPTAHYRNIFRGAYRRKKPIHILNSLKQFKISKNYL